MAGKRRKRNYKFTEKTQSKRGICAFSIAAISVGVLIYVIINSFENRGNGSMYLGSAGVTSLLLGMVSFVIAVKSLREENSFKLFPYLSTVISFLVTGVWMALYIAGMMY